MDVGGAAAWLRVEELIFFGFFGYAIFAERCVRWRGGILICFPEGFSPFSLLIVLEPMLKF